jgi:hypothetical protein
MQQKAWSMVHMCQQFIKLGKQYQAKAYRLIKNALNSGCLSNFLIKP